MNAAVRHPEVVAAVAERLRTAGLPSPDADARWLVEHVDGVVGDPVGCGAALLDGLVARRLAREPLQLILGKAAFRTVEVAVAPGVFIPRPETEVVAGIAIDAARAAGGRPRVVEPCTGTGAIACSLLAEVPGVEVLATDVDPAAAALATRNLAVVPAAHGARGEVRHGALLDPVDPAWRGTVDVLVANPPYLPAADRGSWQPEVADHDPDRALVGGEDGHEVVDALLALAAAWLRPGGTVVLEIDERRGSDALAQAARLGLIDARVERDLTGADRAIVAVRPA
ncbi:MAG: peptide chain release factor N(5)-glutamine methyltransferase [Nitriliruptoraceae bacterium]|nr:peptide chain release factor N(5)-glutamine methyltransferase [Nitriliruptoraceae bacterium]